MIALEALNSADGINGGSNFLLLQDADEAVRIARELGKLGVFFTWGLQEMRMLFRRCS